MHANSYVEFIQGCRTVALADREISELLHTHRIVFNSIKHATQVEVIASRNAEAERDTTMAKIARERTVLRDTPALSPSELKRKTERLDIEQEILEKVRHVHEDLDLDDPLFAAHNGIHIRNGHAGSFQTTLDDLEIALKITPGILTVLAR